MGLLKATVRSTNFRNTSVEKTAFTHPKAE